MAWFGHLIQHTPGNEGGALAHRCVCCAGPDNTSCSGQPHAPRQHRLGRLQPRNRPRNLHARHNHFAIRPLRDTIVAGASIPVHPDCTPTLPAGRIEQSQRRTTA